jgi:hypothetical protein
MFAGGAYDSYAGNTVQLLQFELKIITTTTTAAAATTTATIFSLSIKYELC